MQLLIGGTIDQLTVCAVIQFRHEAQSASAQGGLVASWDVSLASDGIVGSGLR